MRGDVSKAPRGFKKQAFGVVLIVFGVVNVTLNIKTDIPVDIFDLLMILIGGSVFAFGFIQKSKTHPPAS